MCPGESEPPAPPGMVKEGGVAGPAVRQGQNRWPSKLRALGAPGMEGGGVRPWPSLTQEPPVFLQFFAFITALLYILHAFSIYYH